MSGDEKSLENVNSSSNDNNSENSESKTGNQHGPDHKHEQKEGPEQHGHPDVHNLKGKDHHKHNDPHYVGKLEKDLIKAREDSEKFQTDNAALKDSYARKVAEFDNYKKRVMRDMDALRLTANKDLLLELVPVYDNFQRALASASENRDFNALFEGLKIIYSQMEGVFRKFEVKPIDTVGRVFDHNLHEAVMMVESDSVDKDMSIVEEFEKGYLLGDTVLKHSKVKVARKKAQPGSQGDKNDNDPSNQ